MLIDIISARLALVSVFTKKILAITGKSHCGVVDKPLAMLTRDSGFDTRFLQSVR